MLKELNFDIDGFVAHLDEPWYAWIRETFGDDVTPEKVTAWDLHKFCPNGGLRIYEFLENPSLYDMVEPYPGAIEALGSLHDQGYKMRFVTSNPPASMASKLAWANRHFPFIGSKNTIIGHNIDKSKVSGDLLGDDALHNLKSFNGWRVVMDRPYNRDGVDFGLIRVHSFDELIQTIMSLQANYDSIGWNQYFMRIAREVSRRGSCDRAQVGCVLVKDKRQIATGYNGSASGEPHCDHVGHLMRNNHCVRTIHAEKNALINAARKGISVEGATAYVTHHPCWECYKSLVTAGVKTIFYNHAYRPDELIYESLKNQKVLLQQLSC